jgi:hypothetical protein
MADSISNLVEHVKLPKMIKVKQKFNTDHLEDIPGEIARQFSRPEIRDRIKMGMTIALGAGSRGIANYALIMKETVSQIKALGGSPFIVPAMGSHGGATDEGQKEVLEKLGLNEEYIGCEIKSTMKPELIHEFEDGLKVYCDINAYHADAIIPVNRIKLHTCFTGAYESGLMKMMAIGFGKQIGAYSYHQNGFKGFDKKIERIGKIFLEKMNVIMGVGIIENPFEQVYKIPVLSPQEIIDLEPGLLRESVALMPRINIQDVDLLIVDWIGKNFSGDGMDPNITGRYIAEPKVGGIHANKITVLNLTDESYGNACGSGVADTSTRRLFDKFKFEKTYPNSLTSTIPIVSKVPIIMKNQKEAIQAAIMMAAGSDKDNLRIIRIRNTMDIQEIYISEALIDEAEAHPDMEIIGELSDFNFDENGDLFSENETWYGGEW